MTGDAFQRVQLALLALQRMPRKSGEWWVCPCPAHDDRTASFAYKQGDKGWCYANATPAALSKPSPESLALKMAQLFDDYRTDQSAFSSPSHARTQEAQDYSSQSRRRH